MAAKLAEAYVEVMGRRAHFDRTMGGVRRSLDRFKQHAERISRVALKGSCFLTQNDSRPSLMALHHYKRPGTGRKGRENQCSDANHSQ